MGIMRYLAIMFLSFCLGFQGLEAGVQAHLGDHTSVDPAWLKWQAVMGQMHVGMASVEPSGATDADFVALMLPHHQAAIEMAVVELMYGTDPQMRRLAQEIVADQQSEIELMHLWQKQRDQRSPNQGPAAIPR